VPGVRAAARVGGAAVSKRGRRKADKIAERVIPAGLVVDQVVKSAGGVPVVDARVFYKTVRKLCEAIATDERAARRSRKDLLKVIREVERTSAPEPGPWAGRHAVVPVRLEAGLQTAEGPARNVWHHGGAGGDEDRKDRT
jgi:hypothetical protein